MATHRGGVPRVITAPAASAMVWSSQASGNVLRSFPWCLIAVAFCASGRMAEAQDHVGERREAPAGHREVPDYGGRTDSPTTATTVLAWIPRVALAPLRFVFDYGIRRPLGFLMRTAEKKGWDDALIDLLTFRDGTAGLVPTFLIDFGFRPSGGLYLWANDLGRRGNDVHARLSFGGPDFIAGTITDRLATSRWTTLVMRVDASTRPDYVYQGIGWNSDQRYSSRYVHSFAEGEAGIELDLWRASELRWSASIGSHFFDADGSGGGDPSLATAIDRNYYAVPPGFDGYLAVNQELSFALDSRLPEPAPGHGVRLELWGRQSFDLTDHVGRRWVSYGAALGGFVDLGARRVVSLWWVARFADPLGSREIPLPAQVRLGDHSLLMQGFRGGGLVDRSATVATLEYSYPIWVGLDAAAHLAIGNVFDAHLSTFALERLRLSFGLGLRSIDRTNHFFEVRIAFGTDPFARGASIRSVRLVVGSRTGF
jgi:hypothetical protein